MLPLTLIRRPLTPAQADAIMRRAWIVPACFYAVGVAAALVFVALIALDFPALGLRYGLAIVCILLVAFIPAAVAYSRAPSRRPRITATTSRQEERTVTELLITGDARWRRPGARRRGQPARPARRGCARGCRRSGPAHRAEPTGRPRRAGRPAPARTRPRPRRCG